MLGICLTCGRDSDDIEQHHVAGRRNHPTLTVPVGQPCHLLLTGWQRGHGVDLRDDTPRSEVDELRALLVGVLDLLRLTAQRHPDPLGVSGLLTGHPQRLGVSGLLAGLTGRAFSRLLDVAEPADRAGRWLPDPTEPPRQAPPVGWLADTEHDVTVLQATLAADLLDLAGGLPHIPSAAFRHIAAHPHHFDHAWQDLMTDPRTATEVLKIIEGLLAHSLQIVRYLLAVDHPDGLDEMQLEEIRVWVDTGRRLLDQLVTLAGYPEAAA